MSLSQRRNPSEILSRVMNLLGSNFKDQKDSVVLAGSRKTSEKRRNKNQPESQISEDISLFIALPGFALYNLAARDVLVITRLWQELLVDFKAGISWESLCRTAGMDLQDTNECLAYVESLLKRRIILLAQDDKNSHPYNPVTLLTGRYRLQKEFIFKILNRDIASEIEKQLCGKWQNDRELINDLTRSLDLIFSCFGEFDERHSMICENFNTANLINCFRPFLLKLAEATDDLALIRKIRENELDETEILTLSIVLYYHLTRPHNISDTDLLLLISNDKAELHCNSQYLLRSAKLFSAEIIEYLDCDLFEKHRELLLTEKFRRELRGEKIKPVKPAVTKRCLSDYLKQNPAFQPVKTTQKAKDLILPDEDKETLRTFILKQQKPSLYDLTRWGFGDSNSEGNQRHNGFIALFYGPPGTGKTYAAGALANEMGRDLVSINASRLRSLWYGDTEKLVKKAFLNMRQMTSELESPPVFVLNEADQIIHNRVVSSFSTGRIDNSIQSIILEELETFPGILILTTNLDALIDEAYFRRFDLKLKFKTPDYQSRKKLWKLHLNANIPGAEGIDIDYLAKAYHFTGGQIDLVIRNACSEAIARKCQNRYLTITDLIKYSELEKPWQSINSNTSIGF